MPSAARGMSGVATELGTQGIFALLPPTPVASLPTSLTTPIPGAATSGMRLLIRVWNHTVTGTISAAGLAPLSGAAVNQSSITLDVAENPGDVVETVIPQVFASINASGITVTGLTGGTVAIYGICAAGGARMTPGESKLTLKYGEYSPTQQRGLFEEVTDLLRLKAEPEWEYSADLYADRGLWMPLGAYSNAVTQASIPASPTSLLASTPCVTSGSVSLTTQPTAPAMYLQVTIGGAPATAATVVVSGVNEFGEAISEAIVPTSKTAGVYYSENRFKSVNATGVVYGAFGGSATLTVAGVFGYSFTGPADQSGTALNTYVIEQWDGATSHVAPFAVVDEWTLEGGMDKEAKVTAKGLCQYVWQVGDPTQIANQITPFTQPIDTPFTGWQTLAFIDPIGNTPGTTLQADVVDYKVAKKINWAPKWTSAWNPPNFIWSRIFRKRAKIEVEMTLDLSTAVSQNEYMRGFLRRQKRQVRLQVIGPLLGVVGGTTYNKGFTLDMALRWVNDAERDFTTGQESVTLKVKGVAYYDVQLSYSHKLTWFSGFPNW